MKIPDCVGVARRRHRCLLYAHNPHIICAVHPAGIDGNSCLDFREDPNAESIEVWQPEGATYYNGEFIVQPNQRWTPEEQLELPVNHKLLKTDAIIGVSAFVSKEANSISNRAMSTTGYAYASR